jgi:hypothetical protein
MFRNATFFLSTIWLGVIGCTEKTATEKQETPETTVDSGAESNTETGAPEDDSGAIDTRPCAQGDPVLEVGTGEEQFETISNGDDIQVIHGTQDGHHILGSLRTKNTTDIAVIRFQIIPVSDGVPVSDQTYRIQMLPDPSGEPCSWMTVGMYAYLGRIDPDAAPFLDNPVALQMDLMDENERSISQSLEVVPFLPGVDHSTPPTEPTE